MTIRTTTDSTSPVPMNVPLAMMQAAAHVDWRAIIAGAVTAAAISVLLLGFGSAIGLSMTSARPYAGLSGIGIAILLSLWLAAVHIGSFAAGGYLTARLRAAAGSSGAKGAPNPEREFRDGAHGFLVWALGTLIGAMLIGSILGSVGKGTSEAASSVIGVGAAGITQAARTMSASGGPSSAAPDPVAYTVDTLMRRPSPPASATSQPVARDQRINDEIGRIIVMSAASGSINPVDRQQVAALIAQQTGLPQADAEKRVDDTWTRFRALQAEASAKVRDAAEKARKIGVITAFLAAAISLAALAAAIWGADAGATDRDNNRSFRFLGRERFW